MRENLTVIRLIILSVAALLSTASGLCFAHTVDNLPPMHKKNLNEVTDFFPSEITDKAAVEKDVKDYKAQSEEAILNNSAVSTLPGSDKFEETASSLGNMNQLDAESQGLQVQAEESDLWQNAHINYEDPQIIQHKKDTDKIVKGSEDLFKRLAEQLKERFNIECKQKKGPEELEPEMYIELEKVKEKEITYDGFLCEYLRNIYTCTEKVKLECAEKVNEPFAIKSGANYQTEQGHEGLEGQNEWSGIAGKDGPISHLDGNNDYIISSSTYTPAPHDNKYALLSRFWHGAGTEVNVYSTFVLDSYPAGSRFHIVQARMRGLRQIFFNDQLVLDLGGICVVSAAGGNIEASYKDMIDVSHLARAGENKIRINYLSLSHGGGTLKLRATKPVCARWNEKWDEETCVLK